MHVDKRVPVPALEVSNVFRAMRLYVERKKKKDTESRNRGGGLAFKRDARILFGGTNGEMSELLNLSGRNRPF